MARPMRMQCSSPIILGALQYYCYQGIFSGRDPAPTVSVLSFGKSEVVVLCKQKFSRHLEQLHQGIPREVLPDEQDECPLWEDFELSVGVK